MRGRLLVLVSLGVVLAMATVWPGRGAGQGGPVAVSADSILATARDLSGQTAVGPQSRETRRPSTDLYTDYLLRRVRDAVLPWGGSATLRSFTPVFQSERGLYRNVVGVIPGALADQKPGFFMLGAHLDATANSDSGYADAYLTHPAPGADDNASGVSAVLEAIRAAGAEGLVPQASVVIAFFDAEELGLHGSESMAAEDLDSLEAELGPLHGFINFDMVAYNPRQDSLVVLTNRRSRWLANDLVRVHDSGVVEDLAFARVVEGLTFSDHAPFWRQGRDAVLLIEAPDIVPHNPHYHRATDRVENTYSRGGSQVAKAADLVRELMRSWARDEGASALEITSEDIDVVVGGVSGRERIPVGSEATLVVGVSNHGATRNEPWRVRCQIEADGRVLRELAPREGAALIPSGGRARVEFPWTPTREESGSPTVRVFVEAVNDDGLSQEATRFVAVEGPESSILRAYVYPNPTRHPSSAVVHYELATEGPVRLELLDVTGRSLGQSDRPYDPVFPDPGVNVGMVDIPLADLFAVGDLAPGLYFLQLRQFGRDGSSVTTTETIRFAVLR